MHKNANPNCAKVGHSNRRLHSIAPDAAELSGFYEML